MCRINPRIDFAFKKLFGVEENKDLLIDLINSIVSEKDKVKDLILKNPYNEKSSLNDKLSVLDIKAQDEKGNWFNIEIQIISQSYYEKRALYYWARIYNSQLEVGRNYDLLKKTICINILNFNCLDESDYHNSYKMYNTNTKRAFFDDIEIHFIELNKYDDVIASLLDRWVNFLKKADLYSKKYLPKELEEIPTIKKAVDVLERMYLSDEERELYEAGLKWFRDRNIEIKSAREQGIEEGIGQGREQGMLLTIKNFLDILDNETISKKTGIDIEKIAKIRRENEII
jgi:predicted transposase/invertase (TIGR01784 family)